MFVLRSHISRDAGNLLFPRGKGEIFRSLEIAQFSPMNLSQALPCDNALYRRPWRVRNRSEGYNLNLHVTEFALTSPTRQIIGYISFSLSSHHRGRIADEGKFGGRQIARLIDAQRFGSLKFCSAISNSTRNSRIDLLFDYFEFHSDINNPIR